MRSIEKWRAVLVCAGLSAACGADDGPAAPSGTGGSTAAANVSCDPGGAGDCQNEGDCPSVENGTLRRATEQCGLSCNGQPNAGQCSTDCVHEEVPAATKACSECYLILLNCSAQNCLSDCVVRPDGQPCVTCQVASGCRAAFDTCSGLTTF